MQNDWRKFWQARKNKPVNKDAFFNNFQVLDKIISKKWLDVDGLRSLEVGCGRAIISDYLYNDGWDTHAVDKYYIPPENGRKHKFYQADACNLPFPDKYFDLIVSYGLLEHFDVLDQCDLLVHWRYKLKPAGLSIHYIVPKKLTNFFEDRNVERYPCYWLQWSNAIWVYPIIGTKWLTNKYLGKGFWYEDISSRNSKINLE